MPEPDIQDSENTIDKQNVEEQALGDDDIVGTCDGLQEKTLIYIDGQFHGRTNELLVNKCQTTRVEDCGSVDTTELRWKTASGCGHVMHTGAEAGVACLSCRRLGREEPLILCTDCAKNALNICWICNAACCYKCRRERPIVDGEKRVICEACIKSTLRIWLLKQLVKWLIVASAVYYLIKF